MLIVHHLDVSLPLSPSLPLQKSRYNLQYAAEAKSVVRREGDVRLRNGKGGVGVVRRYKKSLRLLVKSTQVSDNNV